MPSLYQVKNSCHGCAALAFIAMIQRHGFQSSCTQGGCSLGNSSPAIQQPLKSCERDQMGYLSISVSVLYNSPGQLRDGESQRVGELEVGPPGLKVPPAQILPSGTLACLACVRPPCQPLQQTGSFWILS